MKTDISQYETLLETLTLRSDANQLLNRLDEALKNIFIANVNFEESLSTIFSPTQKKLLMEIIQAEGTAFTNTKELEQLLNNVKEEIKKIPVIELTLAIDPTEKLIEHIYEWIAENLKVKVLIDTHINHTLIGGLIISMNGYYHDYSVSKLLQAK